MHRVTVNLTCICGATFTDWTQAHQHMIDNLGTRGTHRLEHAEDKAA